LRASDAHDETPANGDLDGRIRPTLWPEASKRDGGRDEIYVKIADLAAAIRAHAACTRGGRHPAIRRPRRSPMETTNTKATRDPHQQLRRLYISLLEDQNHFDEFKQLLALYEIGEDASEESPEAIDIRNKLNARIREWIGPDFDGLSAAQTVLWRNIVVEERINVAVSPWKESNWY
jgi:hypothetical protein